MPETEPITAVVSTRNRGDSLVPTVRSILANTHPHFSLIVIDQSTNEETADALAPFLDDPRLRYLRTPTQGLSRARNIGVSEARSEVIAFTDDDCEVPSHWLEKIARLFAENERIAVIFSNVKAAQHDPREGFIPCYLRQGSRIVATCRDKCRARGIGAGLSVRRSAIQALGGFDEMLGAGAPLSSCEDGDMAVRALLAGFHVFETDTLSVLHYGYRTSEEGRSLTRRDWLGIGAAYAKPLKCGYWRFLIVPAYELFVCAVWPLLWDALRLRKPRGVMKVVMFLHGFARGWRTPVDAKTLLFRQVNS